MQKIIFFRIITMTILWLAGSPQQLLSQNIIWIESAFDSPRLVKTGADGTELLSKSLPAGSLPQSIAINSKGDALFWTGLVFVNAQINSLSSDFNSGSVVVDSQSALRGVALDPVNDKIYWTSTNLITGPKIMRVDMNGLSPDTLINFGPGSNATPRAISLDIEDGKMYWTNFGEGKIQRADLSVGAVPEDILTDLSGPSGLAVDADSGRIFWTEMNGHQIKSADLNGANETLLVADLSYPNYISVSRSENKMAWTEIGTGKVKSAALDGTDIVDYEVTATAPAGIVIETSPVSNIIETGTLPLPLEFALQQNYPNPFNPTTLISYKVPVVNDVELTIYNPLGQEVRTLVKEKQPAGLHQIQWDGRDYLGRQVASGVYLYRLKAGSFVETRKMLLLQ